MKLHTARLLSQFRGRDLIDFLQPPPHRGTTITQKRIVNLYVTRLQHLLSHKWLIGYPLRLTVDASSACNLACPACPTGAGLVGRKRGHLPVSMFRWLMDELGDYLFEVEMHNWGEPLLNPNIAELISLVTAKKVGSILCTNFSIPFDAAKAEALVAAGLTQLGVSLDGASQETLEQYRVNANFERILQNIRLVNEAKEKLGSSSPRIIYSFHIFPHNQHEVPAARALAKELGIDFAADKGWVIGSDWDPDNPDNRYPLFTLPSAVGCGLLWDRAVVNNDGGVSSCEGSFFSEDDFGSIIDKSYMSVWNNRRFQDARGPVWEQPENSDAQSLICRQCPETLQRKAYLEHLRKGGKRTSFAPLYNSNDGHNYFFKRRPERRRVPTDERIDLQSVRDPQRNS